MKVILIRDVATLGKAGSVVEVKEGYARNYLLPRGLAREATEAQLRALEQQQAAQRRREARELERVRALAHALNATTVRVPAKAGSTGKLFGAVTAQQVADALKGKGLDVDRRQVEFTEPIKALGTYTVTVRLAYGLVARVRVEVIAHG